MAQSSGDVEVIHTAFGNDSSLCDRILAAAKENRDQMQLFVDIAKYTSRYMSGKRTAEDESTISVNVKKRKTEDAPKAAMDMNSVSNVLYSAPDTSFAVPQRKKMTVQVAADPLNLGDGAIKMVHEASGINIAVPFSKIEQIFCLPVPEKAQRQWNFVVFANEAYHAKTGERTTDAEQIVWTMNEVAAANIKAAEGFEPMQVDTYVTSTMRSINKCLNSFGKGVIIPTEKEFESAIPQSHRKGEPAYHVKAHKGSKDGYLFFLSCGIVWAFKKPLALFTFENIESISYTSVLQRTFNIVITSMPDQTTNEKQEVEFSMLDQADFAGIDEYVKRHNLNDASMATERRAKKLNVNPKPKVEGANGEAANGEEEEDGETELAKAERELQDQEDEEEEDYDPGSDDDSGGSGSSDEEGGDGVGDEDEEEEEDDAEGDDE